MIRNQTYFSSSSNQFKIEVIALINNHELRKEFSCFRKEDAEKWLSDTYCHIYSETLLKFIHQREQAFRHFKSPSRKYDEALFLLKYRFSAIHKLNLLELVQRILHSEEELRNIMPSAQSKFKSWRETIESLINQCHEFLPLVQRYQRSKKAKAAQGFSENRVQNHYSTN